MVTLLANVFPYLFALTSDIFIRFALTIDCNTMLRNNIFKSYSKTNIYIYVYVLYILWNIHPCLSIYFVVLIKKMNGTTQCKIQIIII